MQAKDQIRVLPYGTSRRCISLLVLLICIFLMVCVAFILGGIHKSKDLVVKGLDNW